MQSDIFYFPNQLHPVIIFKTCYTETLIFSLNISNSRGLKLF